VAKLRSLSRVPLSTGFSRKALVLLLSSMTFTTSILYPLLHLETFVTVAFSACPLNFPMGILFNRACSSPLFKDKGVIDQRA
jgi:hypothetical protein